MTETGESSGTPVRYLEVDNNSAGQRLDNFLLRELKPAPRQLIYRLVRTGQVRVNKKRCKPFQKLNLNDVVRLPPVKAHSVSEGNVPQAAIDQIRDCIEQTHRHYLLINKPAGLAVHAGSGIAYGVIELLRRMMPDEYLELAHRLDRETSGCLLVARSREALLHIQDSIRDRSATKQYMALLSGRLPEDRVVVEMPLRKIRESTQEHRVVVDPEAGKPATSIFRRLEANRKVTYSEVEILTGRMHQIRVHASAIGHPLLGDHKYLSESTTNKLNRSLKGFFLHCSVMRIPGSEALDEIDVQLNLPDAFRQTMDQLLI